MNRFVSIPVRCSLSLFISVLFATGCSSSSDSSVDGAQLPANNVVIDTGMDNVTPDSGTPAIENESGNNAEEGNGSQIADDRPPEATSESGAESTLDVTNLSIPDPLAQNVTRVEFSITVPAYQSDALQVRLTLDDKILNASWVGDELWTANDEFPTSTEHELVVTFSDANGDITLGQYETVFETGTNDSEFFQISTDQFITDQWDSDSDGVSNLDESIAGTDPLIGESESLEIRDSKFVHYSVFITEAFSRRVPSERPYSFNLSESTPVSEGGPPWGGPVERITIDIDENGDGSFYDFYQSRPLNTSIQSVNRMNSGNGISWGGEWNQENSLEDVVRETNTFTNTVSTVDELTRSYGGESSWLDGLYAWNSEVITKQSVYAITGTVIEGTTLCKPVAGSIVTTTFTSEHYGGGLSHYTTTITKSAADPYWEVTVADFDSGAVTSQYYARSLETNIFLDKELFRHRFAGSALEASFKCKFVDL